MEPTLRQIRAFLALAETGNFTRAADRLSLSQPTLSQAIRDLEETLGARLFDRTTRTVSLTEAGRLFQVGAQGAMAEIGRAVADVQDLAALRRGRLRVAAPPLLASALVPRVFARFWENWPGVELDLLDVATEDIVAAVRNGHADLGIGTFPPDIGQLSRMAILRDELVLLCPEGHPMAARAHCTWGEAAEFPIMALNHGSGIRLLVELGFETARVSWRPRLEVRQITTLIGLVAAGAGLAIAPAYALTAAITAPIRGVPLVEPTMARDISVLHDAGHSSGPALTAFIAELRREFGQAVA